jgi:hypothetical protein
MIALLTPVPSCRRCRAPIAGPRSELLVRGGPLRPHHPSITLCGPCSADLAAWLSAGAGTPGPPIVLADELANRRNCRFGLKGVAVSTTPAGPTTPIDHTRWDAHTRLVVVLDDAERTEAIADELYLRSRWPWRCCRPRVFHALNRRRAVGRPRA